MIYNWIYEAPSPERAAAANRLARELSLHPSLGKLLLDRGFTDTAEVHLPTSQGVTQYVQILNFDSPITDYKLLPFQSGLSVTFKLMYEDKPYFGRFIVSTVTGETVLTLITPAMTMRYVGWLSHDRHTPVHKLKASEPVEDLPPVNRKSPTHKQHHRK